MSLRWRVTGELLCGAKTKPAPDDTYIDDRLHYHLSLTGVIAPEDDEAETGRWRWRTARAPYWEQADDCPLSAEPPAEWVKEMRKAFEEVVWISRTPCKDGVTIVELENINYAMLAAYYALRDAMQGGDGG